MDTEEKPRYQVKGQNSAKQAETTDGHKNEEKKRKPKNKNKNKENKTETAAEPVKESAEQAPDHVENVEKK